MVEEFKRYIAYKMKIGDLLEGNVILEGDRFKFLEIGDKKVARINLVANIIDKYIQDDEKKFASITLDDLSGQIKSKTFGDDIEKFSELSQGDTIMIIGLIRQWNNETYIIPEIIKKKDPSYLLLRKLETDLEKPQTLNKTEASELKNKVINIIKREEQNEGVNISAITEELNTSQETINQEIKKLLEEGVIYEPRPGKVRYLG